MLADEPIPSDRDARFADAMVQIRDALSRNGESLDRDEVTALVETLSTSPMLAEDVEAQHLQVLGQ